MTNQYKVSTSSKQLFITEWKVQQRLPNCLVATSLH